MIFIYHSTIFPVSKTPKT